jgi:hypothetical protein
MVAIYIALGIVECAVNLSAHAQFLNTVCSGLLNVTEKFVDKTRTLLTVERQFIIVISFELWGQHSASQFGIIFHYNSPKFCDIVWGEQPMSLVKQLHCNELKKVFRFFFCRFPWKRCFFILTLLPTARYSHAEL